MIARTYGVNYEFTYTLTRFSLEYRARVIHGLELQMDLHLAVLSCEFT